MTQAFDIPPRYNFARDVLGRLASERPTDRALLWAGPNGEIEDRDFRSMDEAGARAAAVLAQVGVKRGQTVLIMLSREIAWWELMLGCLRIGAIASPATIQLTPKDIAYRCKASGAACVVAAAELAASVDKAMAGNDISKIVVGGGEREGWTNYTEAVARVEPIDDFADTSSDEDALCYFTSGTTGLPKMAIHGHGYALAHRLTGAHWLDLTEKDLHWNLSDNGWAKAAWSSFFAPWQQGAAIFTHHVRGFDASSSLDMLERFPITTLCAPPTAYRMLVRTGMEGRQPAALRHCVSAGEPLNAEVIDLWSKSTGLKIFDGYGQTETVVLCCNRKEAARTGSMGKPIAEFDLAVIDDEGSQLPTGSEGDIALRVDGGPPPGLFKGYKNDGVLDASAVNGPWYRTGDRGIVDEDGFFWFVARADDVILTAGYRIGPFEVESALFEHPSVAESAVVASPDEERGEVVKAFVVLAKGYEPGPELVSTLQNHVKATTAPYKYPRRIEFVDALPKTISGKIRRKELRDAEWAGRDTGGTNGP